MFGLKAYGGMAPYGIGLPVNCEPCDECLLDATLRGFLLPRGGGRGGGNMGPYG